MATDVADLELAELGGGLAAEAVLSAVLQAAPGCVVIADAEGRIVRVNHAAQAVLAPEFIGRRVCELVAAHERELIEATLADVARSSSTRDLELSSGGVLRAASYELRVSPVLQQGTFVGYAMCCNDVSLRRGMEAELRESQDKLRIALAASKVGLWSWDVSGDTIQWDAATLRIFGRATAPDSYEHCLQLIHPDDRALVQRQAARALSRGIYPDIEHRIIRPDGEERWVLSRAEVATDATGRFNRVFGGAMDVTDRRVMEDKLRQAQKMEALGELTAGLAHNFNNALMAILPNLEHAARSASAEAAPLIEVARKAADRAARLVSELMVFAGGQRRGERRDEALDVVVQRAVELCRSTFSKLIQVELTTDEGAPVIAMDATQIEHAVMNVCINARDALDGLVGRTPTLSVRIDTVAMGCPDLAPALKKDRDHARVTISDNGAGMPDEVRRRIFEPFFTTKDVGKGTGLGLSTAYAIVREHGGFIGCESQVGSGTTFELYLPVERTGQRKDSGAMALPAPGGDELILLVDDDPVVRGVAARVLKGAGYGILEAGDGEQGLSWFAQQQRHIALVLLDESMPGMAGHEVLARILRLEPRARVAMFTGVQPSSELLRGSKGLIRKPIGANELLWRVRELLQ